jgi:hypothetical protein
MRCLARRFFNSRRINEVFHDPADSGPSGPATRLAQARRPRGPHFLLGYFEEGTHHDHPLYDPNGRNALVTGRSGIGLAMARALAQAGANVAINGGTDELQRPGLHPPRDPERGAAGSGRATRSRTRARRGVAGPIDLLVSNAGINRVAPIAQVRTPTGTTCSP